MQLVGNAMETFFVEHEEGGDAFRSKVVAQPRQRWGRVVDLFLYAQGRILSSHPHMGM